MTVLAVNAGSSSLKFALYPVDSDGDGPALLSGSVDGLAAGGPLAMRWAQAGKACQTEVPCVGGEEPFACALHALQGVLQEDLVESSDSSRRSTMGSP